jgi:hypothetical protein
MISRTPPIILRRYRRTGCGGTADYPIGTDRRTRLSSYRSKIEDQLFAYLVARIAIVSVGFCIILRSSERATVEPMRDIGKDCNHQANRMPSQQN